MSGGIAAALPAGESRVRRPALRHRWSLAHNPLSGITLGGWWSLLCENRFDVDLAYAHRVAFVTAIAAFNTASHAVERCAYGAAPQRSAPPDDPVFILGHWRSGTTHLHNLLAADERFAFPTTWQAVNPFSFLWSERVSTRLFGWMLPRTRPMDAMAMGFDLPQEDELALALLCGRSPYLGLAFPRRSAHYERYLTFDGVHPREIERWQEALRWFVHKVSWRARRQLLLKSPAHTARIALLLEVFPRARFVHIHRDPYEVFQSSRRYFSTAAWYAHLQVPDRSGLDEEILRRYVTLYDAFSRDRSLIPAGRCCEIACADLVRDPLGTLRTIYDQLSLGGFDDAAPALARAIDGARGYTPNVHPPLAPEERRLVAHRWRRCFDAWGYER